MSTHANDIIKEGIMEDVYDMSVDELACRICAMDNVAYNRLMIMIEDLTEELFEERAG